MKKDIIGSRCFQRMKGCLFLYSVLDRLAVGLHQGLFLLCFDICVADKKNISHQKFPKVLFRGTSEPGITWSDFRKKICRLNKLKPQELFDTTNVTSLVVTFYFTAWSYA